MKRLIVAFDSPPSRNSLNGLLEVFDMYGMNTRYHGRPDHTVSAQFTDLELEEVQEGLPSTLGGERYTTRIINE